MTRKRLMKTLAELNIQPDQAVFSIASEDLIAAIAEEVDLETVTYYELREIFFIVRKALCRINWGAAVTHAIQHLPFGLNQTGIAWDGFNPCIGCPDSMLEDDGFCHHRGACKAWEIYEARF